MAGSETSSCIFLLSRLESWQQAVSPLRRVGWTSKSTEVFE
jgi:hypothetical protein